MAVIEEAKIVLEDGTELRQWESYSIDSEFMTPTDGWSFTVGDEKLPWAGEYAALAPDRRVQIWIDGTLQLTGIIDSVDRESSPDGGTTWTVQGRDVLRTLCKANIWPGFTVKGKTVADMVDQVLGIYYPGDLRPQLYFDETANRQVIGLTGAYNKKDRTAKQKKVIEQAQAHPNEGAFEFLARNLKRHGLWIWAMADGGVVISGPEYDQEPAYHIVRKRGSLGPIAASWPSATWRQDRTDVPTYVCVRGKSTAKEWEKSQIQAVATDPNTYENIIEPCYMSHDEAKDTEQCEAFAKQELSRLKQRESVYTVTAVGHRDRGTGNIFAVDTLALIDDEMTGLRDTYWVMGRTFRKDLGGGTTTELRCVPLGTIQFSDVDFPGG